MGTRGLLAWAIIDMAGAVGSAGCYDCTIQGRFLEYRVTQTSGSAVAEAFFTLDQTRGSENAAYVMWHVRLDPAGGTVSAVRLRAGPMDSAGRLLYDFPLVNAVPDAGVITQVFVNTPFDGAVPFDELWDLIQREPVFVEVIYSGLPNVLRIGPLELTNSRDWQDILCS